MSSFRHVVPQWLVRQACAFMETCLAVLLLDEALQLCQGVCGVLSSETLGAAAGWQGEPPANSPPTAVYCWEPARPAPSSRHLRVSAFLTALRCRQPRRTAGGGGGAKVLQAGGLWARLARWRSPQADRPAGLCTAGA